MRNEATEPDIPPRALRESEDFYFDNGMMVLTEQYLRERGSCCKNGCRHCPYGFERESQSK